MKRIILPFIVLLIGQVPVSCTKQLSPRFDVAISILIDKTDPMHLFPTAEEIIAPLGLKQNPDQRIVVRVSAISDRDINEVTTIQLEAGDNWNGNQTIRDAQITRFKRQLQKCLQTMSAQTICDHSIIYRAIARQANWLTALKGTHSYLIVYSNLEENSNVNFYNRQTKNLIQNDPRYINKQLERTAPIKSLSGIQIWLLYSPASYKQNTAYMLYATFFQHLFEEHGAIVHIDNKFLLL